MQRACRSLIWNTVARVKKATMGHIARISKENVLALEISVKMELA